MRNIILNPTKRQVHKINKWIEKSLSSATETSINSIYYQYRSPSNLQD